MYRCRFFVLDGALSQLAHLARKSNLAKKMADFDDDDFGGTYPTHCLHHGHGPVRPRSTRNPHHHEVESK
jgi:hypothetical protein